MCGLYAWFGLEPPNMEKLKILGILNETRGTDSNGLFYNGKIMKGIDKQKIFSDFLVENIINPVEGANTFIGHTRKSTWGEHTEENAHPFLVNNRLVLAHNGTIPNWKELSAKYDVDISNIKVDSLALAYIIEKSGFGVLNEYKGGAALLMHYLDSPNSGMIYHGKSKITEFWKTEEKEERPLYMLKTKTGIYVSSLGWSLDTIKDSKKQFVEVVPYNEVLTITNGKIIYKKTIIVNRGDCNVSYPAHVPTPKQIGYNNYFKNDLIVNNFSSKTEDKKINFNGIWRETEPRRSYEVMADLVWYWKGRYWKTINSGANTLFEICHGVFYLTKKGLITNNHDVNGESNYFWRGVPLKSYRDYLKILNDDGLQSTLKNQLLNFAGIMSMYSKYPLTNLEDESTGVSADMGRHCWFKDGMIAKSSFTPRFSNRTYKFKKTGHLDLISCTDASESPLFYQPKVDKKENKVDEFVETEGGVYVKKSEMTPADENLARVKNLFEDFNKKIDELDSDVPFPLDPFKLGETKQVPELFEDIDAEQDTMPSSTSNKKEEEDESAVNLIIDWVIPALEQIQSSVEMLDELTNSVIASESKEFLDTFGGFMRKRLLRMSNEWNIENLTKELETKLYEVLKPRVV